ncbi:uncharacterized protein L201_006154 [Kwoniella dendrophila CBS 6074]|uniref:AGC-kinase C-terminal domain-containing protein n=1 Tax=Kwoniella dendrophila CBS 6074 TaxID=1295534 RepID=A0AAX4K2V8_9TREE
MSQSAAPVLAPLVTQFPSSSKTNRLSSSSTSSHASTSSAYQSWTPSRDSVYSTSSDGWSAALVTPRGEKNFDLEILNDAKLNENEDQVEYIDLAKKENWWNTTLNSIAHPIDDAEQSATSQRWLDDSPTLPYSDILPVTDVMPSLTLGGRPSKKKLGKSPARPGKSTSNRKENGINRSEKSIFDVFGLEREDEQDQDVFSSIPIRRSFTKRRPSIPEFSTPSNPPIIPSRISSRRTPILPLRASSLKPRYSHLTSEFPPAESSSSASSQRPIPIRNFSQPPPSTTHRSSLKKHRRISPSLLQPISETPKDLDISPDGSWALRRSPPRLFLSKSQPNLKSSNTEMTMKFRLKRSNSSIDNQEVGSDFMPLHAFPSSRNSLDGDREREGRSSFSDMARSFIPRSLPDSPSRMSLDGRPNLNLGNIKKSPKSNSFLGLKKSQSQRRPSLLGLPEWSPNGKSNNRSISDSYIPQLPSSSSSRTLEVLAMKNGRNSPTPSALSIELGGGKEEIFRRNSTSRHSIASSISSKINNYLEEDLLAVLEAEHWNWPSPPFRITRSDSTPGLSTSGTLESMTMMTSPQTPSESEFVLHGETEWLARTAKEKQDEQSKQKFWRPLSLGESIDSLDISL